MARLGSLLLFPLPKYYDNSLHIYQKTVGEGKAASLRAAAVKGSVESTTVNIAVK